MDESLQRPLITRITDEGKIRLRLNSHTDAQPREVVLEPQEGNRYYVHIRTWDGDHVPGKLTQADINTLYDALYDELPDGAEILLPLSSKEYPATRGTIAGLNRLSRDPRFAPGTEGKVVYVDKDGTLKTYKGTSFFKRINENPEYIYRLLIPFALQQGNWNGLSDAANNLEIKYVSEAPWAGMFNGNTIFLKPSAKSAINNLDEIFLHEVRHAYDYSPKWNTLSSSGWFTKIMSSSPFYYNRLKAPIQLRKDLMNLLHKAYPTRFKDRFIGADYRISEKIATNAELRKYLDSLYFLKFNKRPSVKELNAFIYSLSDEEFASELANYAYKHSNYLHTYIRNMINSPLKVPENYFTIKPEPGLTVNVNKSLLNKHQLNLIRRALTEVPAIITPIMLLNNNNED